MVVEETVDPSANAAPSCRGVATAVHRYIVARDGSALSVEKEIRLGGGRLDPTLRLEVRVINTAGTALRARLGI